MENIFPVTILNWLIFIGTISAYIIMIAGIIKNKGKGQNFFTWLLWAVLDLLLYILTEEEKGSCLSLVFGCVLGSSITTLFLIRYEIKWKQKEWITLTTTSIFVTIWIYSGSNTLGLVLAVVSQLIAGWPLMEESWKNPEDGLTLISYLIFILVYCLSILDSPNWEIQNVLFPIAFLIYSIGDTFPLIKKWWKNKNQKNA